MSNKLQFSIDALVAISQSCESDNNVFWINSVDLENPQFVGNNFKKIWGVEPGAMQDNPQIWYDRLAPRSRYQDRHGYIKNITNTDDETNTIEYSIISGDGQEQFISDTSFKIYDAQGNHIAYAGNAKVIPHHLIDDSRENEFKSELDDSAKAILKKTLLETMTLNPQLASYNNDAFFVPSGDEQIRLTRREAESLYYFFQGKSSKEIARILDISHRTVELYFDRIREKFNCRRRNELLQKINNRHFVDRWQFS